MFPLGSIASWSAALFREAWNDGEERQKVLAFLSLIESEASLQGASTYILAVAFRPN